MALRQLGLCFSTRTTSSSTVGRPTPGHLVGGALLQQVLGILDQLGRRGFLSTSSDRRTTGMASVVMHVVFPEGRGMHGLFMGWGFFFF